MTEPTETNPDLFKIVKGNNALKKMLVNYVGDELQPKDDEVTVEMVIEVLSSEFPEILLAIAEENFIRGYRQAMDDVDNLDITSVQQMIKEKTKENKN